ncbi:MAG TPA: phosphatidate cytidylyltransferase [Methylocella sp.]|nr:phosphatidate cytidylyltransferase [Methylocella sp.]
MPNNAARLPEPKTAGQRFFTRHGLADLFPRAASALALMAAAFFSVWQGGLVFDLIWLAASMAVAYEWQGLIAAPRLRLRQALVCLALVLAAFFVEKTQFGGAWAILTAAAAFAAVAAGAERRVWAFGGALYAGVFFNALSFLERSPEYGAGCILWLFAVVWGTDVFAYFGGRLIGGAKLCPRISPAKTWSGTLTGVTIGAILGALVALITGQMTEGWFFPLFVEGFVVASVSQAGDIYESWIKRHFGVKDSSRLIPGHGGFMDRLDGFIAATVFVALFGTRLGGGSIMRGLFGWF